MNSIIYDDEIIKPEGDKSKYYNNFTERLDKRDCVKFALFCAKIVNPNTKESNDCIGLVEKWLIDKNSVKLQELWNAADTSFSTYYSITFATNAATYSGYHAAYYASYAAYSGYHAAYYASYAAVNAVTYYVNAVDNIDIINKYLQILLRKTKQFGNNKILEQISKTDVDKLELVDWNMITDIMLEEYNIVHEFNYKNVFSKRCLIELLRREYA